MRVQEMTALCCREPYQAWSRPRAFRRESRQIAWELKLVFGEIGLVLGDVQLTSGAPHRQAS
jgi:hypothetical protein